jgi:hypothetical protein
MPDEPTRTLFSRNHDTVSPRLGVFLAGLTPAEFRKWHREHRLK